MCDSPGGARVLNVTNSVIPQTQHAAVRDGSGPDTKVSVKTIPVPRPAPHQILVKINWSGLCASDKCLLGDEYVAYSTTPLIASSTLGIAGHEGAGVVVAIESTCGVCEMCSNGLDEAHCPSAVYHAVEVAGTFQEYCVTDRRYTTKIPDRVADEEAGPIICGGYSAYAACKRTAAKPGKWLVILRAGGGVGHFALQYAKIMGMRVIAIDGGKEKKEMCRMLGAEKFINFSNDVVAEVMRITTYGAQGVLVAAPPQAAYDLAPLTLQVHGTIVVRSACYSEIPTVVAGSSAALILSKRLSIVGSLVSSKREADEALDFAARGLLRPVLTKGTLHNVDRFCDLLQAGKVPRRVVLQVST
ncbi:putative alcohol dehydrogenase [Aspergillus floccosus]